MESGLEVGEVGPGLEGEEGKKQAGLGTDQEAPGEPERGGGADEPLILCSVLSEGGSKGAL